MPAARHRAREPLFRKRARCVVVAQEIKPAERCREQDGGEVRGGQACHHGQGRKQRQQREHGLDAFAGGHDAGRLAEAHRVAKQMAHGAPRIVNRGLAVRRRG